MQKAATQCVLGCAMIQTIYDISVISSKYKKYVILFMLFIGQDKKVLIQIQKYSGQGKFRNSSPCRLVDN